METALAKGGSFPISDIRLNPQWQPLLDEPRFRELSLQAHDAFNEQRVLAGLDPVESERTL